MRTRLEQIYILLVLGQIFSNLTVFSEIYTTARQVNLLSKHFSIKLLFCCANLEMGLNHWANNTTSATATAVTNTSTTTISITLF